MSMRADSHTTGRLTRPRQAVYEIITEAPQHLSAVEIDDALRQRGLRVAHASVYNALHYLVATGLIAEVLRPDGTLSYDRSTVPHDHVLCRVCNRIADVWRAPEDSLRRDAYDEVARRTGYTVERHHVAFVGLCPACREQDHSHHEQPPSPLSR